MKAFLNNILNSMTNASKAAGKKQALAAAKHCDEQQSAKHSFESVLSSAQQHAEKQPVTKRGKSESTHTKCAKKDNAQSEAKTANNESASQTDETSATGAPEKKHIRRAHHKAQKLEQPCDDSKTSEVTNQSGQDEIIVSEKQDVVIEFNSESQDSESAEKVENISSAIIQALDNSSIDDNNLLASVPMNTCVVPSEIVNNQELDAQDIAITDIDAAISSASVMKSDPVMTQGNIIQTADLPKETNTNIPESFPDSTIQQNPSSQSDDGSKLVLDSKQWTILDTPEALTDNNAQNLNPVLPVFNQSLSQVVDISDVSIQIQSAETPENNQQNNSQVNITDGLNVLPQVLPTEAEISQINIPKDQNTNEPQIVVQNGQNKSLETVETDSSQTPKTTLAPVPLIPIQSPQIALNTEAGSLDLNANIQIQVASSNPELSKEQDVQSSESLELKLADNIDVISDNLTSKPDALLNPDHHSANDTEGHLNQNQHKEGQTGSVASGDFSKSSGVLFKDTAEQAKVMNKPSSDIEELDSVTDKVSNDIPTSVTANIQTQNTNPVSSVSGSNMPGTKSDSILQFPGVDTTEQVSQGIQEGYRVSRPQIVLRLSPEDLGDVNIRLTTNAQQQVTAHLLVNNQETQELLQQNMHQLKQNLESKGIQVEHLTVTVAHETDNNTKQFNQSQNNENFNSQGNTFNQQQNFNQQQQNAQQLYQQFNQNPGSRFMTSPFQRNANEHADAGLGVLNNQANAHPEPYNPDGSISVFA